MRSAIPLQQAHQELMKWNSNFETLKVPILKANELKRLSI